MQVINSFCLLAWFISDVPVTGTMMAIPLGMAQEYGTNVKWVKANSAADVAGAVQYPYSVGYASGDQNLGLGESVGYGFKFRVQNGTVYTGAHIASYKNNATDANTSTDLVFATRSNADAGTGATNRWRLAYDGDLFPFADNSYNIGSVTYRVKNITTANAVTVSSDGRYKTEVRPLSEVEKVVAVKLKSLVKTYKLLSDVAERGVAAPTHIGVVAQEVVEAFASEGLDAHTYGIIHLEEEMYGVRYEQLLAFIIAAM